MASLLGTGCTKSAKPVIPSSLSSDSVTAAAVAGAGEDSERVVYTPFGPRKAADVVILHPGAHLRKESGQLLEVDKSGAVLRNLGEQKPLGYVPALLESLRQKKSQTTRLSPKGDLPGPSFGTGWITDGVTFVSDPVTYFSTTWTVPAAPAVNGALIYIFNGLEDAAENDILQPVLQYGAGPDGGGNYWSVNNWYVTCSTCAVIGASSPTSVSVGTTLTGVMQQIGVSGSNYNYTSSFTQYPGVNLTVDNIPARTVPFETLEVYNVSISTNYPQANDVQMTGINLQTAGGYPSLFWDAENRHVELGQHTVPVSNANPGGEVDLYFTTPIGGAGDFSFLNDGDTGSGTITGYPGQLVYVDIRANGHPEQTFSLELDLTGGTFYSNGGSGVVVTNSEDIDYIVIPASGTVTWHGYYSETNFAGNGSFTVEPVIEF